VTVGAVAPEQPNEPQVRCHSTTRITKVKERCLGSFLRARQAVSHASWPCRRRLILLHPGPLLAGLLLPGLLIIPGHPIEITDTPSAIRIAWAIRSSASPPAGPLTFADGPPTGRAGPMSGPAGLPMGSHAFGDRKTPLFFLIPIACLQSAART
jgi:hypothetical protein